MFSLKLWLCVLLDEDGWHFHSKKIPQHDIYVPWRNEKTIPIHTVPTEGYDKGNLRSLAKDSVGEVAEKEAKPAELTPLPSGYRCLDCRLQVQKGYRWVRRQPGHGWEHSVPYGVPGCREPLVHCSHRSSFQQSQMAVNHSQSCFGHTSQWSFERAYERQDFSNQLLKFLPKVFMKRNYVAHVREVGIHRLLTQSHASKFQDAVEISIKPKFWRYSFRGRLMN